MTGRSAVACALEIDRRSTTEPQFTAVRGGVHFGPVLYREGGYVGSNVNIASRVAGEARRVPNSNKRLEHHHHASAGEKLVITVRYGKSVAGAGASVAS